MLLNQDGQEASSEKQQQLSVKKILFFVGADIIRLFLIYSLPMELFIRFGNYIFFNKKIEIIF